MELSRRASTAVLAAVPTLLGVRVFGIQILRQEIKPFVLVNQAALAGAVGGREFSALRASADPWLESREPPIPNRQFEYLRETTSNLDRILQKI